MKQRPIPRQYGSLRGWFAARKGLSLQGHASHLELDLLILLALDPRVESIETQVVIFLDTGKEYAVDVLVRFVQDPKYGPPMKPWLIEVKLRKDLFDPEKWPIYRAKIMAARRFAAANGMRFKILTEQEIRTPYLLAAKFLLANIREEPEESLLDGILADLESLRECEVMELAAMAPDDEGKARRMAAIWFLVATRRVWADLSSPLQLRRWRPTVLLRIAGGPDPDFFWSESGPPLARTYFRSLTADPARMAADPDATHTGIRSLKPGTKARCGDRVVTIKELCEGLTHAIVRIEGSRTLDKVAITDLHPLRTGSKPQPIHELSQIPAERRLEAIRRRDTIRRIRDANPRLTTDQMRAEAIQLGVSLATLYRLIKRYLNGGQIPVPLLSASPEGGRGKHRVGKHQEEILDRFIQGKYLTLERPSMAQVLQMVSDECDSQNISVPCFNTLRSRILEIPVKERMSARYGRREARMRTHLDRGNFPQPTHPLEVVQIDDTPVDLAVLCNDRLFTTNRANLKLAKDVFSHAIVGFDLSLQAADTASLGRCIAMSILPKEGLLKHLGLNGKWSCWGIPTTIHLDNAKPFEGEMIKRVGENWGFGINNRPVRTPQFGGGIESEFKKLCSATHMVPGTTFSSPKERGDYQSEKNAVMTLSALRRWLVEKILEFNSKNQKSLNDRSPLQVFEEGILGSRWIQPRGEPRLPDDFVRFRLDLLPMTRKVISTHGVTIKGQQYSAPELSEFLRVNDPDFKSKGPSPRHIFRYDPDDLGQIYFWNPVTRAYITILNFNDEMRGITAWEERERQRVQRLESEMVRDKQTSRVHRLAAQEIVDQETEATKAARKRSARRNTRRAESKERAGELQALVAGAQNAAPGGKPDPHPLAHAIHTLPAPAGVRLLATDNAEIEW